jgi:hypothetical protein
MEKPTYCDHCGNLAFRRRIGDYFTAPDDSGMFTSYILYRCEICGGAVLEQITHQLPADYGGSKQPRFYQTAAEITRVEQLWPPSLRLPPEAPARVREIYEEARSVMRRSPSSFVVQIGRALEAVTSDRGTQGHTLNERLNWLIKEGHLPEVFGEMGHISRMFRNWGAHDTEIDVESEDVEVADEFFKAIIEYLYVAPAKVSRVQSLIQQRQSNP